jgi:hypothetical protein
MVAFQLLPSGMSGLYASSSSWIPLSSKFFRAQHLLYLVTHRELVLEQQRYVVAEM